MIECRAAPALLFFCLSLLADPRPADAGACPHARVRVFPDPAVAVPTNVRLRLVFEAEEVMVYELTNPRTRQIRKSGVVRASAARVTLRDMQGRDVPVTLRRPPATRNPIIFVRPSRALPPGTRYAVVLGAGTEEYVISHLTTGAGPATSPPTIGKIELAIYSAYPRVRHWKDPRGRYAFITLGGAPGATACEVHELDGSRTASDATLRAVVHCLARAKTTLRLEEGGACHEANFRFPVVRGGGRSQPLRLGIRAVDDAGNASQMREVVLDLGRPGRYVRPGSPGLP